MTLASSRALALDLLLELKSGFDYGPTPLEDRAQTARKLVFSFLAQDLLVHLENFDPRVLKCRLHRLHVLPIGLARFGVLELRPVLEMTFLPLGVGSQILLELGFIGAPLLLERCGGLFDVALDGLGLNLGDGGSLHEKCFFVANGAGRSRLQALASVPSAELVQGS